MTETNRDILVRTLPMARRYARALTGSQEAGDALVAEALRGELPSLQPRLALYAAITQRAPERSDSEGLSPRQRQLLLLTALEDLSVDDAGAVVGIAGDEASRELETARAALRATTATDVLVIEDEPIIAMDVRRLVEACGHRVVGVASSEAEAVRLAAEKQPGLILADINLGRGGDGSAAVARIQKSMRVPVIFVTAYPERLLTARGAEPTFIISKPFEPRALAIATYQATTTASLPIV